MFYTFLPDFLLYYSPFLKSLFSFFSYSESFVFNSKRDVTVTVTWPWRDQIFHFVPDRSGPFQPSITVTVIVHYRDRDRDRPYPWWTVKTVTVTVETVTVTVMDDHGHGNGRSRWWTVETVRNDLERYGTVRNDLERSEKFGHGHVTSRHVFG